MSYKLGKPKYKQGDIVKFNFGGNTTKVGVVEIVDPFGTFDQKEQPSYDIFIKDENTLYKHIVESSVIDMAGVK